MPPTDTTGEEQIARDESATARFHVDVATRQVSIQPLTSQSRAVFSGNTVHFTSSLLLDQPGNVGRKALQVALVNQSGETLGQLPDGTVTGLRVIFGPFTNVGAFSDLRPLVQVSTLAGSGASSSIDGPAGSASLYAPKSVACGADGSLYVTESGGQRIRKLQGGLVSTLAGNGSASSKDGFGTAAAFHQPFGIAVNPVDGALMVAEYGGQRVRRVDTQGRVTTVAGTGSAGDANGVGNAATFRNPAGVAVDASGIIYLSEYGGHRLRKIVLTGSDPGAASSYMVSTLAGSGASGSADGNGASASFSGPIGLALHPDGGLYVADKDNHRIRRVSLAGEVVTIAGTGTAGGTDGSGEAATFNQPAGICAVGSTLVVSDMAGHTLRQVRPKADGATPGKASSWLVQTLAGKAGTYGTSDGTGTAARFRNPMLLGADRSGNILIPGGSNQKIRQLVPASGFFPLGVATGSVPTEAVQLANADSVIPNGDRPALLYPEALPPDATTVVKDWWFLIPEGVTAFEFTVTVEANTAGIAPPESVDGNTSGGVGSPKVLVRTLAGSSEIGFMDGTVTQARFYDLVGIAIDASNNVYVVEAGNNSVRRIGIDGRVSTIAGILGSGNGSSNGPGTLAKFYSPRGLAVTPDGQTIYVSDCNNARIQRIALTPGMDPTNAESWSVSTIAGNPESAGSTNGAGNIALFTYPTGIVLDSGGNIFVTEYVNRVRRLQYTGGDPSLASNWQVSLVAGDPGGASGTTDGVGSLARFNALELLAVDRGGLLLVPDLYNNRIRKISNSGGLSGGTVSTISGSNEGYADGLGVAAMFKQPYSAAVDSAGFIYVSDMKNHRIRRISPSGVVTTVAGTGVPGGTDGRGDIATLDNPRGIAVDAAGNLYVAENSRIRLIQRVISTGQ